jgi:menaquinone-dependent protoporphyrinogen oxidase
MRVLVAVASKHGATAEIASAIGATLEQAGIDAVVIDAAQVTTVDPYAAAVIGSGAYAGHWLKAARALVDRHGAELSQIPVWLFSSGPLGDPLKPQDDEAVNVDGIIETTAAVDHRVFAGALDKDKLSFAERAIIRAVRADDGDYRDWDAIEAWARGIAEALRNHA